MDKATTAVFVPSYCLKQADNSNLLYLTEMSRKSVLEAIKLVKKGYASRVILSTAYDVWQIESLLKNTLLARAGIDLEIVNVIPEVTNSYDEAAGIRHLVKEFNIETLIVVADKWHEPRATETFRLMFLDLVVFGFSFTTPVYQMTKEKSTIKRIRTGFAPLWILRNILFWFLTPYLAKREAKRGM